MMTWQALDLPRCNLPESLRFAHGLWMWVDIDKRLLYRMPQTHSLASATRQLEITPLPDEIACILPTADPQVLIGLGRQGGWLIGPSDIQHRLAAPFDSALQRFNDGRADAAGRIWISTLVDARTPDDAALYCIESGHALQKVKNLTVGNGLAFSPQGDAAFLSDTRHKCIWRYQYDSHSGMLSNCRLIKQYTEGTARPDGACFSADGSYWVAILEGYRLDRFSPDGHFIESVELPVAKPTMPGFGGPSGNLLMVCAAKPTDSLPNRPGFEHCSLIASETSFSGFPEAYADLSHLG